MTSHGVEISIAGGRADEKDGAREGSFFIFLFFFIFFYFFYLYHIFVVKVQEIAWSASYGENKTQNPKRTNKGNIRNNILHLGSVLVPGPHTGAKFNPV